MKPIMFVLFLTAFNSRAAINYCQRSADAVGRSCLAAAQSDYQLALAKCANIASASARKDCEAAAKAELADARQTCKEQLALRRVVCDKLGGGVYDPVIVPSDFSTNITNPFFPLTPGKARIYVANTADGVISNVVLTTHNTVVIQNVTCVEVHDTVYTNGKVTEDTLDWFAQDNDGNVWYFGENTLTIEDGLVSSTEGSFKAGINGDKAGIIMKAHPAVGDFYRQEFVLGQGEDVEEVISLNGSAHVPAGDFTQCVEIEETTALEGDDIVHDFYAAGLGPVLSIETPANDRFELVEVTSEP